MSEWVWVEEIMRGEGGVVGVGYILRFTRGACLKNTLIKMQRLGVG